MTKSIVERRAQARHEIRTRRITDVPIEMWSWADLGKVARNMFERYADDWISVTRNAWSDRAWALREIQIYLAHEVAGWPYDRCRQAEGSAFPLLSYAAAVSRFRSDSSKFWIGLDMRTRLLERR